MLGNLTNSILRLQRLLGKVLQRIVHDDPLVAQDDAEPSILPLSPLQPCLHSQSSALQVDFSWHDYEMEPDRDQQASDHETDHETEIRAPEPHTTPQRNFLDPFRHVPTPKIDFCNQKQTHHTSPTAQYDDDQYDSDDYETSRQENRTQKIRKRQQGFKTSLTTSEEEQEDKEEGSVYAR